MGSAKSDKRVRLCGVNSENWRDIASLEVSTEQHNFVAQPAYYLAMCAHGGVWQPLAIALDGKVIGFLMWGYDSGEGSCWLGGFIIDYRYQRRGYGRQALSEAIDFLSHTYGYNQFALSYQPTNTAARRLYTTFGFSETEELVDNELIARFEISK